jgi:hypothetical protein
MTEYKPMLQRTRELGEQLGVHHAAQMHAAGDGRSANDMESPWRIAFDNANMTGEELWAEIMSLPEYLRATAMQYAVEHGGESYYDAYRNGPVIEPQEFTVDIEWEENLLPSEIEPQEVDDMNVNGDA